MPIATDPEETSRLYEALRERILAKNKERKIQKYHELLRSGQPLSEIMARAERALDGPQTGAPDLAGKASARRADAKILAEPPASDSTQPRPTPERLPEPAPESIARRMSEPHDWMIARIPQGEPISGANWNRQLSADPASAGPAARRGLRRIAPARLSPIARLGLAAGAIVAPASIGVLLMHPNPPSSPPASAAAVSAHVEISSIAEPAATAKAVAVPPPTPSPSAQLVPEAPEREMTAAVAAPAQEVAPAEPVPEALPAPASPTPEAAPAVVAPAQKIPPDQPHLAAAQIAALLARGDSLLGVGDIASARLFYERATDAGDGRAALRLGATYDPGFLDRVQLLHVRGDAAQALSWYRRARELGDTEAERWIQGLENKSGR
jgi:hypothetical protein